MVCLIANRVIASLQCTLRETPCQVTMTVKGQFWERTPLLLGGGYWESVGTVPWANFGTGSVIFFFQLWILVFNYISQSYCYSYIRESLGNASWYKFTILFLCAVLTHSPFKNLQYTYGFFSPSPVTDTIQTSLLDSVTLNACTQRLWAYLYSKLTVQTT